MLRNGLGNGGQYEIVVLHQITLWNFFDEPLLPVVFNVFYGVEFVRFCPIRPFFRYFLVFDSISVFFTV